MKGDDDDDGGGGSGGDGSDGDGSGGGSGGEGTDVKDAAAEKDKTETTTDEGKPASESASSDTDSTVTDAAAAEVKDDTTGEETAEGITASTEEGSAVSEAKEKQGVTFGSAVKGVTRLATLPVGVLKDLIQGGVIVAGKNFGPRVRNVLKGETVVNRAEVRRLIEKEDKSDKEKKK